MIKRVVFAWEMGGGLGHVTAIQPIAKALADQGVEVFLILQDLSRVEEILDDRRFRYFQAPLWLRISNLAGGRQSINYAELLAQFAYLNEPGLRGLVKAWRQLFEAIKPDLLIVDHAPTALLAARDMGFPRVQIGSGFQVPPIEKPMPAFAYWEHHVEAHLLKSENKVLDIINKVLVSLELTPYKQLSELFHSEKMFLSTFQELDHFPNRKLSNEEYVGPIFRSSMGIEPVWPTVGEKKIFVYLSSRYWDFEALFSTIKNSKYSVLAYVGSSQNKIAQSFNSENLHITKGPINLAKVINDADLMISNSGSSAALQFLLAGCPLLSIPTHLEQYICGKRIDELGLGLVINPKEKKPNYQKYLKKLVDNEQYTEAAKKFAKKYESFNHKMQIEKLVQRLIDIKN